MLIYIGTYQGLLIILQTNLTQIKVLHTLKISQNSIKSLCNLNNQYLIAGGYDQEIKVVDLKTYQQKIQAKQNKGQITAIQKVNNNKFVIGIDDGTLRLWNSQNWSFISQARFHKKYINSICALNQGKLLLTSGGNKIILWNGNNLRKAHQYNFGKDIIIQKLRIVENLQNNNKYIFYNTSNNEIWKINTENNEQKLFIKMQNNRKIQDFILYKGYIIVGNDIGQIMAWRYQQQSQNLQNNKKQEGLDEKEYYQRRIWFKAHESRIKQLKIMLNQYLLVATASGDVSVWDFPQFIETVEHVSQNYQLDGLKPLCSVLVKGRILCLDIQQSIHQEQVEKEQQQNIEEIRNVESKNRKKSKQIKNNQKVVTKDHKNGDLNKKQKKKMKLKLKKDIQNTKNKQTANLILNKQSKSTKTKKISKKTK